jgi:hypothetical protein
VGAVTVGILSLARRVVDQASERGVVLRLTGSIGVREHCAAAAVVLDTLDRAIPLDVDLFGYVRQHREIDALFKSLSFAVDPSLALSHEYGLQRLIYYDPADHTKVEVFLDVLRMSHSLDFRGRLEKDFPTLSVADMLLAKLQIFRITEKDIKDILALLGAHELATSGRENIEVPRLLGLIRQDWGLYYTARKNFRLVQEMLSGYDMLAAEQRAVIADRLRTLEERIEAEPKTLQWRMRAAVGTRVRWYEEVGDVEQR